LAPLDGPLPPPPSPDGPLRLIYVGRLQRFKGVHTLVEACHGIEAEGLRLRLVGADTPSAPGGGSMLAHLRALAGGDPRIEFLDRVPFEEVAAHLGASHVLVAPCEFELYANVAREALQRNRPVL